jgi:hypothetical protein
MLICILILIKVYCMNSISVMQNLTTWIRRLPKSRVILTNLPNSVNLQAYLPAPIATIHTSSSLDASFSKHGGPKKWPEYNEKIYPPQAPEEERRPAVSKPVTQRESVSTSSIYLLQ